MKAITSKLAALAIGLALFAGMATAQNETAPPATGHHSMHRGFMGAPEFGMMFHRLNLSEDQKAQVGQILKSEKATLQPLRQQEMAAHQQMFQLITSGNFDQAKAANIAAQESRTHLQLELEHAKIASQIYEQVLNSDQKSKVAEMMAQHAERMQQRQEKGESAQPKE